jgi:hypothetical protein
MNPLGAAVPWIAALLTGYFLCAGDVSSRTKVLVGTLFALTFVLPSVFVAAALAGFLLQVALCIGLLLFFRMRPV